MAEFEMDADGFPVLHLAVRAPGQVAAQPDNAGAVLRGARSGNPNADVASGRFAPKGGKAAGSTTQRVVNQTTGAATSTGNADSAALQKRRDLVRRAASQMAMMTNTQVSKWLSNFVSDINAVNVDLFLQDVRSARIDYLVEAMAPTLRTTINAANANMTVKTKAPKEWTKRVINDLTDDEVVALYQRLQGQGFDTEDINKQLVKKLNDKARRDRLAQVFGEGGTK